MLRDRAAAGTAVMFSSHQLDLVEELCDDVVVVAHGRDRLGGTLDSVRAAAGYRRLEVRLAGGAPVVPPAGTEPDADARADRDGVSRLRVAVDAAYDVSNRWTS